MKWTFSCALAALALPMSAWAGDVDLDAMRDAVSKYQDIEVALAEGYITPDNHCVSAAGEGLPAELGAMGMHFIHPALLEITGTEPRVNGNGTHTDWMRPSVLIYEPQADGSMELVAVENLVFQEAWETSGKTEELVLNGRGWDHMADDPNTPGDEAHGFMPHFDQHVWLFRENPMGVLMPFNPNVTCEHHQM
ncbi:hypothetical protein SAMN05421759_107124 [Roseivivax lentus]|uniref:Uncharacterized protein n=1 Tax=Roseivivax lentus TaxID=633194 RepID=A0A1N7NAJ8_9RHOB|nr:hypothetical protein [Roseivivax lentus]SIS95231.1 hypothetical protein SAMN05421759_107124 [Roseivivax lentus]